MHWHLVNKYKHISLALSIALFVWAPYDMYSCEHYTENVMEVNEEAVYAALRSKESCNPVLRAQSRATLLYYRGWAYGIIETVLCKMVVGMLKRKCNLAESNQKQWVTHWTRNLGEVGEWMNVRSNTLGHQLTVKSDRCMYKEMTGDSKGTTELVVEPCTFSLVICGNKELYQ